MATRSMPTVAQLAGVDGEAELGADAVGGGDEDRVGVAGGLEVEERAEAAEALDDAGARGRRRRRLDPLDERVAGVDVDARRGVGETVRTLAQTLSSASLGAPSSACLRAREPQGAGRSLTLAQPGA